VDNRHISVQSEGRAAFDLAFQLLFDNCPGRKATHYFEHSKYGFLLLWHEDSFNLQERGALPLDKCIPANKLPYPMGWKEAADLAWGWLLNQPKEKYEQELDHDGSNGKGFLVYNEDWGHVAGSHYAFLGVKPVWAWYGK
jgi:hypothetical protein